MSVELRRSAEVGAVDSLIRQSTSLWVPGAYRPEARAHGQASGDANEGGDVVQVRRLRVALPEGKETVVELAGEVPSRRSTSTPSIDIAIGGQRGRLGLPTRPPGSWPPLDQHARCLPY